MRKRSLVTLFLLIFLVGILSITVMGADNTADPSTSGLMLYNWTIENDVIIPVDEGRKQVDFGYGMNYRYLIQYNGENISIDDLVWSEGLDENNIPTANAISLLEQLINPFSRLLAKMPL